MPGRRRRSYTVAAGGLLRNLLLVGLITPGPGVSQAAPRTSVAGTTAQVPSRFTIVGFGLDREGRALAQLRQVAKAGNGVLLEAGTGTQLEHVLRLLVVPKPPFSPGDSVRIRVAGAVDVTALLRVDPFCNVSLPGVGVMGVRRLRIGELAVRLGSVYGRYGDVEVEEEWLGQRSGTLEDCW